MAGVDRRRVMAGAAAAAVAGTAPGARAAAAAPSVAKVRPVTDTHFGVQVTDPYRWMEDAKDPDWLPFLRAENGYTRSVLDRIPDRGRLLARITALSGDTVVTRKVQPAGARLFYEQRPAGADNFKLFVREGRAAARVLIDPTTMTSDGKHVSLDWWEPSDDGALLAYGLSPSGSEASVLHVMRVATGEVLPERIDKTDSGNPSWLPDGSGFFYTRFTGERGTPQFYLNPQARLHRLGTDPAADPVLLERGADPAVPLETNQSPFLQVQAHSGMVLAGVADVRPELAIWTAPLAEVLAGKPRWRPVCGFPDAVTGWATVGPSLYLLSNRDAVRGRVLKTAAAAPDLSAAKVVLPMGPTVLEDLHATRSGVLVTTMDGGVQRLRRISAADDRIGDVALPFEGSIGGVYTAPDRDDAYLDLTGWLQPRGVWRLDPASGAVADTGLTPRPAIDTSPYETRRTFAVAKDGVRIPVDVISRRGRPRDGSNPTLVTGYGAYQFSIKPAFSAPLLAFLDAGGIYAVAHVRGGGEYGREWHFAGQKAKKSNTWRDLIAACEQLIAEKATSPDKLAITGTSAGGITVGRALTERPDLFAAVISNVGWSNPIRYVAEQNSFGEEEEWGTLRDEAGFRGLLAMDSYLAVRDGVKYPAVLCITGATDPRVAPFHVAKFAARLQAATRSGKPVLLRVDFDAGHGIGSTRAQSDALAADMYGFVLWRTGTKGFQTGG